MKYSSVVEIRGSCTVRIGVEFIAYLLCVVARSSSSPSHSGGDHRESIGLYDANAMVRSPAANRERYGTPIIVDTFLR